MFKAVDDSTKIIQGRAKQLVAVDEGTLSASIHAETYATNSGIIGRVFTSLDYAGDVEFGSGGRHFVPESEIGGWAERHGLGHRGVWVSGRAQPFMKPAVDQTKNEVREKIGNEVNVSIHKIIKK